MSNVVEYSSKSVAIRGIGRMGITDKAEAEALVSVSRPSNAHDTSPVKYLVDKDAVSAALAAKQRGDGTVAQGTDKGDAKGATTSKSAAEQMTQDEIDNDLAETCGYSHCPSCGIHLSNGIMDFDSLADQHGDKKAYEMQKHAWSCMGCNAEWGDEIEAPKGKGRKEPTRHYVNKSTVDGAVAKCHELFSANPDLRRKDAIQLAVDAGIAFYTARTQYQKWFKAQKATRVK